MSDSNNNTVNRCLRAVWQRSQRKHAIAGLLAFARWFVPLFVAVIIIDRYAYFPSWIRALVAIVLLLVAIRQALRHGWSKLQAFHATRVAKQVEKANGGMDSLLVTAVEFEERGAAPGTSADMWQLAVDQAQKAAADVEPEKVIKLSDLKKPCQIAGAWWLYCYSSPCSTALSSSPVSAAFSLPGPISPTPPTLRLNLAKVNW